MDLKLYYTPGACSLAAHIALQEAGASFEPIRIDLAAGQQRSAEYLVVNPRGRVPTLVVDGVAIDETIAILMMLSQLFPQADLLPASSPLEAGRAFQRMTWLASTAHVTIAQIFRPERFTSDPATAARLKGDGLEIIARHFAAIEGWVADGWVLRRYSVLDAYVLVFWRWGQRLGLDLSVYPAWSRHAALMLARPTVAAVLAREQAAPAAAVIGAG